MAEFKHSQEVLVNEGGLVLNTSEYNYMIAKKLPENPKVFISLPMRGRTDEEVRQRQTEILEKFQKTYGIPSVEFIDSFVKAVPVTLNNPNSIGAWCLGDSIKLMAFADVVIFAKDYLEARGCIIEHTVCLEYGIPIMFEED